MTTPAQAALLAKHRRSERREDLTEWCGECNDNEHLPCDVHRMAELKDAEIAELRDEINQLKMRMVYMVKMCGRGVYWYDGEYEGNCELSEEHQGAHYDGLCWFGDDNEEVKSPNAVIAEAVSEAVERIVEALEKMRPKTRECAASSPVFTGYDDAMADAILILRSRDWSKGEATHE
jgi:hypothetical protein